MVCHCVAESGVNISVTEMWIALKSDLVPAVHLLREWLNGLRPWSSSEPDWIDIVASQVRIAHGVELCRMVQNGVESSSVEKTMLPNATQPLPNTTPPKGRTAADVEHELTQLILKAQKEHEEIILEVTDYKPGTEYGYNTPCPPELQKR